MERALKYLNDLLGIISSFNNSESYQIKQGEASFSALLNKVEHQGMELKVDARCSVSDGNMQVDNLTIESQNRSIDISGWVYSNFNSFGEKVEFSTTIKVTGFYENAFRQDKTYYCRKVIPITSGSKIDFYTVIENEPYKTDGGKAYQNLIPITLLNFQFHIFLYKINEQQFIIIDCLQEIAPELFSDLAWSIIVGVGYLLGHLPQNEEYTFYYSDKDLKKIVTYKYRILRPTYKSLVHPVSSNPSSWIDNPQDKKYDTKYEHVSYMQLGKLCEMIHIENDIKAIIILVLESMTRSMLLMPAGLSIALEGLSTYFYDKNETQFRPITDENLAKEFRKELNGILKKYSNSKSFQGVNILKNKIDQINQAANADKLEAPFKILNIPLSNIDKEVLKYRNAFLHGNITLKSGKKKYKMRETEVAYRLYTLINCIILKMIGFNSPILNQAKIQSQPNDFMVNEDFVRNI